MRWSDKKWYLLLLTIIVIYVFHVCYNEGMMFQGLCSRGTRLLLATHFCLSAWNTLLPFCTKHSHSQNMATNVSNCSPKITMKKTKGHKLLFGVHWTGKKGLPKMRNAPLHKNLLSPLQRGFTATITLRIINLFTSQPNFLETFCTL